MDYEQPYIISLLEQRHQEIFWNLPERPKQRSRFKVLRKKTKSQRAKEKTMKKENTKLMVILHVCFALSLLALAGVIQP